MRLLLRSIVLDNSAHLQYCQILSKIVAGVNSHKKLRKSQYHSESVILPINNGLGSVTLSQIQINKPEFDLPIFLKSHVELLFHLPRYALLILTSISIFY